MRRLRTVWLLAVSVLAATSTTVAQQTRNVPTIGYLSHELPPSDSAVPALRNLEAFRQGLMQLGYQEGKNIYIEYRHAEGKFERLPELAEELVRFKVDIIFATNSTAARAARSTTSTIPIVIGSGSDPIQSGLVASLPRPGGNVTGLTNYSGELLGKRLELLKEVVPKVSRFAFLDDDDSTLNRSNVRDAQAAAQVLGVRLELVEVKATSPDIDGAFRAMAKERVGGLITGAGLLNVTRHRKKILQLVEQTRIPAIYPTPSWLDAGGLVSYGADLPDLHRRAATYVDKILKGVKPADLPVERPNKFDLGINLKAAKQIGLTIPPQVLARADRVIK